MPENFHIDRSGAPFDRHMMALALRAARLGLGTTAPNPSVGAVIADETSGEVISLATTAPGGRPHAEPLATLAAGDRARGKTMYVTLEPCSHVGHTPPCVDAVLAAGLARVVVAQEDPDPRVAGRGLDKLRKHGVEVTRGVLGDEARWLTRGHIVRVTERRPFIQLKLAVGPEGTVPRGGSGQPLFVTGDIARAHGHMLRARADAILVGAGTVRDDDPDLTCRLPGLAERSPVRVVLAGETLPPASSKLANAAIKAPVWVMASARTLAANANHAEELNKTGCRILQVGEVGGRPWLPSVCEALVGEGITRLLVEGGPTVWRSFANAGLVDEVCLFRAAAETTHQSAGTTTQPPFLGELLPGLDLSFVDRHRLGPDDLTTYRHRPPRTR